MTTSTEQKIQELQSILETAKAAKAALQPEFDSINSKMYDLWNTIRETEVAIQELSLDLEDNANDISWILSQEWSQKLSNTFCKVVGFDYHELGISGYFPATGQKCIKISLFKDYPEKSRKIWDKMVELLQYVIPHPDGYRKIDIFEHTLSEHGSVYIYVDSDNIFYESFTRYGREKIKKIGNTDTAFQYFLTNHYYE